MKRNAGITVVELLIASAILMVLLGSLGGILVSTRRGYETNRQVSAASAQLQSAIAAMQYDIGLAGYCPDPSTCSLSGDSMELSLGEDDVVTSITSRYEETRFTGSGAVVQSITYSVSDGHLVRAMGSDMATVADGITRLELVGYRSRQESPSTLLSNRPSAEDLSGIDLRVFYQRDGRTLSEDFTIGLANVR